jgi:adenosylhomocysteine nucleosidase
LPPPKLHIFTAIHAEAKAIRPVLPPGVELTIIGIRAVRLPQQLQAGTIIMAGFAGALDPSLRIGDIVHDDPPGTIHTSTQIIATPADKAALFAQTGAKAVDMENAIVRAMADRLSIPFFGVRAISDTATDSLDPAILSFVDETGRLRPAALAKTVLQRPALIPQLNHLRLNSAIAGRTLANALRVFFVKNPQFL